MKTKTFNINTLIMLLWVLLISTGIVYNLFGNYIIVIAVLILGSIKNKVNVSSVTFLAFVSFSALLIVKALLIGSGYSVPDYYSVISYLKKMVAVIISMFLLINRKSTSDQDQILKKTFVIAHYFSIILSIYALKTGIGYYRIQGDTGSILLAPNWFVIQSICFAVYYMDRIINEPNNRARNIIFVLLDSIYILESNYTMQSILLIIGFASILLINLLKSKKKAIIIMGVLLLIFIIMPGYLANIVEYLNRSLFDRGNVVSVRMDELVQFLRYSYLSNTDLGTRFDLYKISINTFFKYPIVGVPFSDFNSSGVNISCHSEWPDQLGTLGVVGVISLLMCIAIFTKEVGFSEKRMTNYSFCICLLFFAYGMVNPFLSCFFIATIYLLTIKEKTVENAV